MAPLYTSTLFLAKAIIEIMVTWYAQHNFINFPLTAKIYLIHTLKVMSLIQQR